LLADPLELEGVRSVGAVKPVFNLRRTAAARDRSPEKTEFRTPNSKLQTPNLKPSRPHRASLSGLRGIVGGSTVRVDRPDFEEQTAVQTGVALSDLRGFVEVISENEPIAADHFLGFAKRAVCYHILPRDCSAFIHEPLPAPHFSLINQLIEPGVELVDYFLYFIPR
jgi:hypothetical protein